MKTYYITDSTIFNKAEDVVKALMSGETVLNDDARMRFVIKTRHRKPVLMVQGFFAPDKEWDTITPRNWTDAGIIEAMDAVVEDWMLPTDCGKTDPTMQFLKAYFGF